MPSGAVLNGLAGHFTPRAGRYCEPVRVLVVSPHFDDAPLSVGQSLIDGWLAGHQVTVGVVFSRTNWTVWFYPTRRRAPLVSMIRRAEEAIAARRFGYRVRVGGASEAILRTGDLSPESILDATFDAEGSDELAGVIGMLRSWARDADAVLVPAGIGDHVDHRIVTAAGSRLVADGASVAFYEDRPYACAMSDDDLAAAVSGLGDGLTPHDISPPISDQKHRRIWYPSQLDPFFHDAMRLDEDQARRERVWAPAGTDWLP